MLLAEHIDDIAAQKPGCTRDRYFHLDKNIKCFPVPLSSTLPAGSFDEFCLGGSLLGIDEAGRGPVIGPMAVCGFSVSQPAQLHRLREMGVRDSKALPATKREVLFEKLQEFQYHVELIQPVQIDAESLTELTLRAAGKIFSRFSPHVVLMDAPTHPAGIPAMAEKLKEIFRKSQTNVTPRLVLENKADEKYLTCMAASIVAKVTRDHEIEKLRKEFGDFGSGYCSDPKTIKFLKTWNGDKKHPVTQHIRHKWSTVSVKKTEINDSKLQRA